MDIKVFIDGACRGNPGPGGIGVVIYKNEEKKPIKEIRGYVGETTNNIAEYMALIRALEELQSLGVKTASIFSDSQLLVRQMAGEYKVRSENLLPLFSKAQKLKENFQEIELSFVRREKNKIADKLANLGIDDHNLNC